MQIWITFILINIIYQTHVSTAPVDSTFGKIADAIINPAWTFNNPDSPKKDNKDTDLNKKNDENLPITVDGEIDYPNKKKKKKNNSRKKNKRNGKKRNNNKRRKRNNGRRNNTRRNGRYLWYNVFTMDDLLVNLPEYRNHEDEQNIVLIWDDKRRIVQNEHVDALSMNNLNNNQLIRQKRDYNNILELQDNILRTRNINQHDLKKNENSMSSNSNENTNENMKFLNLRNSNTNKFKNILQNKKQSTNTITNKISRPNFAQSLGITLGANNSEKEGSQLKIIEKNPRKVNAITTLSNDKPELIIKDNTGIDKNSPEIEKIDTLINGMNSNSDEGADDDQNSESYPSSIETKNKIPNYSNIEDNKQHDILKNIKHPFKPKTRKLEKNKPKNYDKGTLQTRFTPNVPSINQQKIPSIDISEHKTEGNTDIAKNIPVDDEIDTLINTMNSNSEEDSSSDNSDPNTSSLEKQQDILDFSNLGDNKRKNLSKSIKQPLKPISNLPGHITPEHTDVTKNIPINDEIETLMNTINSNSEEGTDDQNSESNPSSLEKQRDTLEFSDLGDNKGKKLLKSIKQPLKPISNMQGKKLLVNNEKLPGIYEQKIDNPLEINKNNEEEPQQKPSNPITQNLNKDKIKSTPAYHNFKPNIIQKKKSIKTPDLVDTIVPKTTDELKEFSTEISLKDIDVTGSLEGLNNLGGITMEEADVEKVEDKSHSSALDYNNKKNHDDILKIINQPIFKNPNTGKSNTENAGNDSKMKSYTPSTLKNIEKNPKHLFESRRKKKLDENSDSNSIDDLLSSSISFDEVDLSKPELKKKKVNPKSKTSQILNNSEDTTLKSTPHDNNLKPNIIHKNKPIKTPDLVDTIDTETTNEIEESSIEIPLDDFDVMDSLEDLNNIGGMTMKSAAVGKIKDKSNLSVLNNKNKKDHKDSFRKTNENPNKNIHITSSKTKNVETPKLLSGIQGKKKLDDTSNSNSINDSLSDSLDLSQPGLKKKKVIAISKTNDIIKNVEPDILKSISLNTDDKSNAIQKNKSIKTPILIDTSVSKSTEKVNEFSTELPLSDIDLSDSLGEYNNIGGFTIEDAALEKIKDESPSMTLNNNGKMDHDDSLQVTNQPTLMKPNTRTPNTGYNKNIDKNTEDNPNSLGLLLLGFDEQDLPQPGLKKKKVIPMSKTNDIITNVEDDKLKTTPINIDDKPNTVQKNKSIKTQDLIDTSVPKSTEKVNEFSTESSLHVIDLSDPLGEYNNIGEFTMEDSALEKIKDESPSMTFNNNEIPDNDDSLQVTNQPVVMKPNTVNHNTEYKADVDTNIEEIPKKLYDGKLGANSYGNLFGGSIDTDEEDLSQPGLKKNKVIPMSKTNDIITNVEDDKLKTTPINIDDKPNTVQKNKSIKTQDLIDTSVPKSTEKVNEFSTESSLHVIDLSDPLGEYNNIGEFTMEDSALEKIKDESPSMTFNNNEIPDNDDSLQVTNQPVVMKPNTVNHNTEYKADVDTNIEEIPKKLYDGKLGANSYGNLFGGSIDTDEEDLSQPGLKKNKVIPMSKTNDIITNVEDDKLKTTPINIDDKPNTVQKNKSIQTQDLIDTSVPKSTEKVNEFSTESPLHVIDLSDPLGEYNNIGGFTMEDSALEKIKDESPSMTFNNNEIPDNDDSLQVTNQPVVMKPNTVNHNTEYKADVDTNIEEIPKKLYDGKLGANSYGDLFGGSIDTDEEDLSQPGLKKNKVIPMSKTNDIITNVEDDKLKTTPINIDDKPNTVQKNKSIQTQDLIDTSVPKSTEKVNEFSTESPLHVIDLSDPLGEYNNIGGFTMEDSALEKIKDESPSMTFNNNEIPDNDDSLQVTNQPVVMKPNTVNHNTEYKADVDTNIEEIPKKLYDGTLGANSYGDLFGGSLDTDEEDLSQPGLKKNKVIPMSKTNDIITNVEDDKFKTTPINIDDKPNTVQKNKSIKTQDLIDTSVPKSTEKVNEFSTESPLHVIDLSDPLGEYNNIGGFTMEDSALEKIKDESPSMTFNNNEIPDNDDSLQVTNQPVVMKPNTVNHNTEYKADVDTNIEEIPKKLYDGKLGANSYGDLFGGSIDTDEEDLSQPGLKKNKVIPMSKTNDIITNVEDDKLKTTPINIDDKPNTVQKNKSIQTQDLIDTSVPKSTEKVNEFSTESPLHVIDLSDPLGEYNNIGGFTMEDSALEKIKDESPSMTFNNNEIPDNDDSLQVTNQPVVMKPNTVNHNTEYKADVDTNIEEIPKKLYDGKLGANSYGDLFGGSIDTDEEDLSQPGLKKNKVIPMSKTNDIITNVEDDKLKTTPINIDDKPNTVQKNKSIQTQDLIDTSVPKSTEKVNEFSTESPLHVIDLSDPLGEYNNIGGFTMEDSALEKIKDESPSMTFNNNEIPDNDDSLQVTNQPVVMKPNTVNHNTEYKADVDTNIEEIPKKLYDGTLGANSYGDLFGGSLDTDEEDLSQPGLKKNKVIPMSKTNDIITNVEDDKLKTTPINIDDKPNTVQKNKSIQTQDLIDTSVPKSTEKVNEFSTESPLHVIDLSDPLGEYNNIGGFTMEDSALEKIKDESPSMTFNNNEIPDNDDSLQVTNQPVVMKPNTVNHNTEYKADVDTNIEEIPKKLYDGKLGANSYGDLFGGSIDTDEEDLSQPGLKKNKVIPMSKTNDIITNVEDDKLKTTPINIDDKPNTVQKNKSIQTQDLIDTSVPKSTEKVNEFSTESPLHVIDLSDPLGEYNNIGGFTMEDSALEKIKDESPSMTFNNNEIPDNDDSLQVTNQPVVMKPNTVNHNTEYKADVDTNIEEIPKKLYDGTLGANSYGDLFGGSLDTDEEDLSQPGLKKNKVIPMSKTNDIITNVEDDKFKTTPINIDDKPNTVQKNKSIKTQDLIDTSVPKSTEKVNEFSTESPLHVIDLSDPLGEYNNIGGFTMEDSALEKIKDESPSMTFNNNEIPDNDDSLQVTNQPVVMKPNTVNHNTEYKADVDTNIEEIPKKLYDGKLGANSYGDLFGGSIDTDEEDLSQPGLKKNKVIPMSKTNDIITNVEDDKLKTTPINIDDKPNTVQKNKSIQTQDLIDTSVPKSTEKVNEFSTESPLHVIDLSDPLGEYNNIGGFTMEDSALEKIKDESPSMTFNNNEIPDNDDSLQVTNQPVVMKPNTVNHNTEYKADVDTNIEEIPKKLYDGKLGANSYGDLFGGSIDTDEEDLSQPGLKKNKVIPMSKTNDIITNVEDDKLKTTPINIDDKPNTVQKNKSIQTQDLIDTSVPKSTEKVNEFSTESPLHVIDLSDPLGEYNNIGGFTMEDSALEKIKDESPSMTFNNNEIPDNDDSLQVTNQPVVMKPNTVNHNTEYKADVDTNIEEIPKKLYDGKFGANSYGGLFGGSLDSDEEDLSQPGLKKNKVIPLSKANDIITYVEDDKLKTTPINIDDKPNTVQKNKSIKTQDLIDTSVPKSTEKVNEFSTESPLHVIDLSDPLGEYNNIGGFTMEDSALEKINDESPSMTFNNNEIPDNDDSLQVTNQPVVMKPNTVNHNTEYKTEVDTNIEEIPKKLYDGKLGANSYGGLFGGSIDTDEEDLSQPGLKKNKVIPMSKTNDIITNVEDDKLKTTPINIDDKPNTVQENKSIKTQDLIDTSVPKSTEKVNEFLTELPLNDIDLSGPLGEYNSIGGFTMEDDKSPSSSLNNYKKKNRGNSRQKINEPKLIYPVAEESNTEYNVEDITNIKTYTPNILTNIEEIPNILPNLDDITLKSTLTDDDNKPNSLQKSKLIKELNSVSNTDSKMFDLIEPTTQTNYNIIKNNKKLPLKKVPSNVVDKHSSNSKTMQNNNNNSLNNNKDVTFNSSFITNRFVEYNSKDLSSLEGGDRYGYMLPKFSTKYNEGDESNYNLWETIPPKKSNDVSLDKGYDNLINDFNQSSGYTTKNNKISTHTLNENHIVTGTESVKNNYNNDIVNTDIHNKQYDDFIKKMSEQLFKKIDNIDDKLAKLDKVSHNCSYVREIINIGSHEPTMNNVLLTKDINNTKPEKVISIEDSYSKTNKPIESLEINISNKSDDENEINKNVSPKTKKHKNKKHKRHGRDNKKKGEKNNKSNNDDGDDDDDDDDDNDDDNHKNNKHHKHKDKHNDDNGKDKKNKRHKNKDINNDDGGKHKKNKRHKNKDINNDDGGKHKKNKRHKKNKTIGDDNDNGGHRKKSHKKKYSKVDNDVVSKHKKHRSHKKKNRKYNDVEIFRSKKTDNKKKKKFKKNVYSPEESNDINYSSSIQINSENNDSVKRLRTTNSKSKISKKSNSTKSKKSSPKKKSKYVKHSKTIKYKNKEIPEDVSDEDTSSNENNYSSEKTYIKYISNNNQDNVPKDKKHKHSKTSKTYIYKKIPEDKDSDENSINLEETYNINIISDDDALRQKKHRHKKNKKKKNFDINIVKDTDTNTQVLNNDKKTQNGFQFYTFYPQYRYATLNPFARLLTNSYL